MNLYFVFFSVYAVLIAPVTLRFRLRIGKEHSYLLRVQAAGMPFFRKRENDDKTDERPLREQDVAKSLVGTDLSALRQLLKPSVFKRVRDALRVESLTLYARISFADAAQTALVLCAAQTTLRTVRLCGFEPRVFSAKIEGDFWGRGTEVLLKGIISARLGKLGWTIIQVALAFAKARAKQLSKKEEAYAASH